MIFPSTFIHCCSACCTREFSRKFCLITISFYYQIGEDGWYWRKIESRIKKDVQVFLFSPHFLVINDNFAFVFNMILSDIVFFSLPLVFEIKSKPPVCTRARSQPDIDDHKTRMNMCRKLCSVWINSEKRGTGTNSVLPEKNTQSMSGYYILMDRILMKLSIGSVVYVG